MNFGTGKHKDRSLEVELNLAPFLDIMSVCVCFLLTTTVWMSVSAIPVSQSSNKAKASKTNECEIRVRLISNSSLELSVRGKAKVVLSQSGSANTFDDALTDYRGNAKACAFITPASGVDYAALVSVADVLRKHGVERIGLTPKRGRSQ